MNNTLKIVLGVVILGVITYLGMSYPKSVTSVISLGSSAGATFGDAKFAGVAINLASPGSTGTSTSILNPVGQDVYVTDYKIGCEGIGTSYTAYTGAGLAALTMTIGTTSASAPAVIPASNVVASAITVATSSTQNAIFTSKTGGGLANVWAAGTYMTFWSNATNTAVCTVGVDYMGS